MADIAKRLILACIAGGVSLILVFAVSFVGFHYWATRKNSEDDQVAIWAFLFAFAVAVPASAISFALTWSRLRKRM